MKFLKTSIVVLFILSLSSAALSLYLSNIRENEKEKRIYLEGVKADLEGQVAKLESDKVKLSEQVDKLENSNQDLKQKLKEEQTARQEILTMISQKDADLESLRGEAQQAQTAFQEAQKRNQELERILDELESRMRQIEGQGEATGTEVGYLEVQPVEPKEKEVVQPADLAKGVETVAQKATPEPPEISFKPLTQLPEPPKKRKFLSFLGGGDEKSESKSEPVSSVTDKLNSASAEPVPAAVSNSPSVHAPQPVTPVEIKTETPRRSPSTADQAIAAGNVLLVNRKYNFVVINLGSRQSLGLNDVVSVQKEGKEIAKARVEKIYDDYSAAYIVEEQSDHPIAEGDSVARI